MASSYHIQARELIKKVWPTLQVIEEWEFKIGKKSHYLDFYVVLLKLGVEIQGEQHYSFNTHFHKSKAEFLHQLKRDRQKAEKLEELGIRLITLPYNEIDTWPLLLTK